MGKFKRKDHHNSPREDFHEAEKILQTGQKKGAYETSGAVKKMRKRTADRKCCNFRR